MSKILITGGGGFVGSHLAERLAPNHQLVLFDNGRRNSLAYVPELKENPAIQVVTGDILDDSSLASAFDGVDTVLHLAAIAGVSSYYSEPVKTLRVNILGTINVLEQAARRGVRQVIDFSTSEIFGSDALNVDETMPAGVGPSTEKRWVYAASKLAGEQLTLRYGEEHGFSASVLRPFNVYGPRQTGEGAISNFMSAALDGTPLTIYGDGTPLRAWCYVSDMVDAVIATMERVDEVGGQVFNIGNPTEVETTLGLARRIARLVPGATLRHEHVERAEVRARVPVISHAQRALGFHPKVDLDQGLAETLDWMSRVKEGQA